MDLKSLKIKIDKSDFIFQCRKCYHLIYITKASIMKMIKLDCPECGEEAAGNWIFNGEGKFK